MKRSLAILVFILAFLATGNRVHADWPSTVGQFNCVEVEVFRADEARQDKKNDPIPDEVLMRLQKKIVAAVAKQGTFKTVYEANIAACSGKSLLIGGNISRYEAGDAALRFTIGFGAGNDKIVALVSARDKASGQVLLERRIAESSKPGFVEGEPAVERQFARNVAVFLEKGK